MEEVLKAIKEALKKAGVSENHAERVQKLFGIEKNENIDNFVFLFKDNVLSALDEAGKETEKSVRKKAIADYEKKHGLKAGKPLSTNSQKEENSEETETDDDFNLEGMDEKTKAFLKSQSKAIADLTNVVSQMVKSQTTSTTLQTVREKLKGKIDEKFIEKYAKRVNLDAEDLEAEIENAVKEYADDRQLFLNEAVAGGAYIPAAGNISDRDFDDYAKRVESQQSEFEGRKI